MMTIFSSLANKPTIQRSPEILYRLVEGQNVVLPCEISDLSVPKVIWSKQNRIITGGRYRID